MAILTHIEIMPLEQVPGAGQEPQTPEQRQVVLVVDDERVIADTLSIILSKSGYAVHTAYDAASALAMADVIPPDLLLSDVMMGPGMDGTQLAIAMMMNYPDCKVILFSGHAATQDLLERAREMGHNFTVLSKPLHPAELLANIQNCFTVRSAVA
jgi:CheY-like chemotaxis protein